VKKFVIMIKNRRLLDQILMLPKHSRGKLFEKALALYLESDEGAAVFEMLKKDSGEKESKPASKRSANVAPLKQNSVRKIFGDLKS